MSPGTNEEAALEVMTRERPTRSKPADDQNSTARPESTAGGLAAVLAFDVDAVREEARLHALRMPLEERTRAALAVGRARFEAAEFLVDRGSPTDARLAARWLLGMAA